MEEIITSLGSIKIIIIIIITWVSLGRKSRERFVFPLFGWLEERRKQGIWHPSGSQTNSFFFFFFLPPFATKHSVSGRESDEREEVGWLFWDLWNTFKPCPITISPSIPILAVEETAEDGDDSERWAICVQRMRRIEESEERAHQQNILSLR